MSVVVSDHELFRCSRWLTDSPLWCDCEEAAVCAMLISVLFHLSCSGLHHLDPICVRAEADARSIVAEQPQVADYVRVSSCVGNKVGQVSP